MPESHISQAYPDLAEEREEPIGFLMAASAEEAVDYSPPEDPAG